MGQTAEINNILILLELERRMFDDFWSIWRSISGGDIALDLKVSEDQFKIIWGSKMAEMDNIYYYS